MAFLLGYGTAIEWLRQNTHPSLLTKRFDLPPLSIESSRTRLQRHANATANLTRPLHLVVANRESRRPSGEAICHLFAPSAYRFHAVRVDKGVYCCGPELAFVQMANVLDEDALLMLGMELCGRYGISRDGKLFARMQTCTPAYCMETASELGRVRGKLKALDTASRLIPGAASPMEAALALMLHEPPERGGFGLKAPELNHALNVYEPAREFWDDDFITPDLLWDDKKLSIEYDSDMHHTASSRIARDALRRDVLSALGYHVITVTTEHLRSPHQIERIARTVAQQLNQTLPATSDALWTSRANRQARLRTLATNPDALLGFWAFDHDAKRAWHARSGIGS